MNAILTKRPFAIILSAMFSFGLCFASDDEPKDLPIPLTPIKDNSGQHKPKSPSYIKLSAYLDNNTVVVTSNVDIMAHVLIYDSTSGQTYFNNTISIAPQNRCQITHTDAMLTLQITVDDTIYTGDFSPV